MADITPRKEWWTATEIAEAKLPDLPDTRQGLEHVAKRNEWRATAYARPRAGRGGGWEYSWRLFPLAARRQLLAAVTAPALATVPKLDRDTAWAWFDALPQTVKDKAMDRLRILQQVEAMVSTGLTKFLAVALVAKTEKWSDRIIWDWFAMVEFVRVDDRLPYLAPRNRAAAARPKLIACPTEFFDRIKTLYLRLEGPTFKASYDDAVKLALANSWEILHEKTARRRLDEQVPRVSQIYAREGERGLARCFPPQTRDRSQMVALEGVNADCHKIDVFVMWPGVDKPMRPQIVAFQDLFSNKILSWRVDRDPNKVAVMSAFGELVETYGIPKHCLFDNGHEFANKWLTGGTKTRFRFKIREDDPLGVLPQMGIQLHWARPAHGQAKPIERAFGDFANRIAKDARFAGAYVGNRPDAKPENYASRAIPLADFMRVLEDGIRDHNARQGRVTVNAAGRSFDDTFAASYATAPIRKATAEQRRLWLMGQQVLTLHKDHGLLKFYKAEYWSDWMNEFAGKKIVMRFDPENLNDGVYIYALSGEFMGFAECKRKTPFFDLAGAREQARIEAQRRKVERQLLASYRTVPLSQVAAELDAVPRAEPTPMEAKVVQLAQASRGPLIERPAVKTTITPEQEQRHSAFVVSFEGAAGRKVEPAETARDRFKWALEMERALERAEELEPGQYQRLATYQQTPEYSAEQKLYRNFGDAIFG